MPRTRVAMDQHLRTRHKLPLSQGEVSQLIAECHPRAPLVQQLKRRMEAAQSAQGGDAVNNLGNQKVVSQAEQQAMQDRERETRAVSLQLAAAFAAPAVKEGLSRLVSHKQDLEQLIRRKWAILQSGELHFGLDRTRSYPVLIKVPLLQNMGLSCLTFIPEQLPFPSITVSVELGATGAFRVELIDGKLVSVPPHIQRVLSEAAMLFLTLAVVVHYIDLFITTEPQKPRPAWPQQAGYGNSTIPLQSRDESSSVRVRTIPRQEGTRVDAQSPKSQQRPQTSQVDPFRRRLPPGQIPSFEKVLEADSYGIDLAGPGYPAIKYTWVRPYIRGETGLIPHYLYRDYRAVGVFETLLDAMGFFLEPSSGPSQGEQ